MASNIRVTELDFDTIKENLKTHLRAQSEFTDYDFDASNLNVLLDLLAYNTHYNAVLANMVANEMFLDTALKRSSVVSLAKMLNYTPRSVRGARAKVTVALQSVPGNPAFVTLNAFTPFTANIDGTTYTFFNTQARSTTAVGGVYTFSEVDVYQGRQLEYFYTVQTPGPTEKYAIPNNDVDIDTLRVSVQYGGTGSFTEAWTRNTDIMDDVNGDSTVYYLQENAEGLYEVYFGDGVLGRQLESGDIVKFSYLASDGDVANASTVVPVTWSTNSIAGESGANRTITAVSSPTGGAAAEDVEQVRFRSVNTYATQNRAVTRNDYATIISANLPGAQSVNVWGGEENNPPEYGKVFISIAPRPGYVLTDSEKTYVTERILRPRGIVGAQAMFVDPVYTYVNFRVHVRFNDGRTTRSSNEIAALVNARITEFFDANLERFNAPFYRSQLEEQLMDLDDSILSVNLLFDLVKRIPQPLGVRFTGGSLQFPSRLHPNEVRSSYYYFTNDSGTFLSQVRDVPDESPPDYEGTGTIKAYNLETGAILEDNVGTVNYATGLISFNSEAQLTLTGYPSTATALYIYAGVQESVGDIFPGFNEILQQDDAQSDVVANIRNGITIEVQAVAN